MKEVPCTREHLRLAIEMISDYLTDEWADKIMAHFNISEVRACVCRCVVDGHVYDESHLSFVYHASALHRRKPPNKQPHQGLGTRDKPGMSRMSKIQPWNSHMGRWVGSF